MGKPTCFENRRTFGYCAFDSRPLLHFASHGRVDGQQTVNLPLLGAAQFEPGAMHHTCQH